MSEIIFSVIKRKGSDIYEVVMSPPLNSEDIDTLDKVQPGYKLQKAKVKWGPATAECEICVYDSGGAFITQSEAEKIGMSEKLVLPGSHTENPDGSLTRHGMEQVHRYAVRWIDDLVRDLSLEREFPELAGSFYDVRADPQFARASYIPFDDEAEVPGVVAAPSADEPSSATPSVSTPLATRWTVRQAITWRLVAELFRRHHKRYPLRVYETHPCDGQYDCVTLGLADPFKQICDFHVAFEHFHPSEPVGRSRAKLDDLGWPEGNNYVHQVLAADDPKSVIENIEDVLGLERAGPIPRSSPAVICLRVIAGFLSQMAFERVLYDVRCGWADTSEQYGQPLAAWVATAPPFTTGLGKRPNEDSAAFRNRVALRLWRLEPKGQDHGVILDLGTGHAYASSGAGQLSLMHAERSLWDDYQKHRRISALVDWVIEAMPES